MKFCWWLQWTKYFPQKVPARGWLAPSGRKSPHTLSALMVSRQLGVTLGLLNVIEKSRIIAPLLSDLICRVVVLHFLRV